MAVVVRAVMVVVVVVVVPAVSFSFSISFRVSFAFAIAALVVVVVVGPPPSSFVVGQVVPLLAHVSTLIPVNELWVVVVVVVSVVFS